MSRANLVLWYFCLIFALGCALAFDIFAIILEPTIREVIGNDFAVFWTAARIPPRLVYDFDFVSAAQGAVGKTGLRPFASPPTLLSWLAPFGALSFKAAFALWTIIGLGIFYYAGRRLASRPAMLLAMLSPAVVLGVVAGQVALFVSGLLMLALTSRRAAVAGAMFGLAATIKPQALLLVPLALVASRDYRTLGFAALTGGVIGIVDLAVRGALWLDWLHAMTAFSDLVPLMGSGLNQATPNGFVVRHGLEGLPAGAVIAGGLALGCGVTWFVFRGTDDPGRRAAALGVGYVLCSPYAGAYELTMVVPAAAAILLDRKQHPLSWFGASFGLSALGAALAPAIFGATLLLERLRGRSRANRAILSTG
jgi:hypothetical protein